MQGLMVSITTSWLFGWKIIKENQTVILSTTTSTGRQLYLRRGESFNLLMIKVDIEYFPLHEQNHQDCVKTQYKHFVA